MQDRRLREISAILGYSTKSITLSLQELIDSGVVELRQERDGKHLNFLFQGRELWNIISPHLTSPIKKELRGNIFIIREHLKSEQDCDMIVSGYDAGLHIINESSISFPRDIAISEETFKEWTNKGVKLHQTEGATRVEVWKYDPLKTAKRVIATDYCVDPLSLVLTYRDSGNKKLINYIPKIMQWVVWKG